ncbi:hypothetical protein K1719_023049 [Acacia pycnantha]|nr:hypothetical protein K1719_023049 [Acacia pycnantha]
MIVERNLLEVLAESKLILINSKAQAFDHVLAKQTPILILNTTSYILKHVQNEAGEIQVDDAEDQERTQDLQMMTRYVFECLRPEDKVIVSPFSYLTQEAFITLKPETSLDSVVIDTFVEILTDIERKKKTLPLNWYLPVTFSDAALKGKVSYFLNFVHCQKIKENYMSDLESCDKSIAMEKLFEKVTFTEFHRKTADDILLQPNGCRFYCGVFVINYMQQSDNYVKRDSSFQFDSKKEREDLALKLLNNDLNEDKQNLYDKARRRYAQVDKQDGNKRLRVDTSKEHIEDVGREMEAEYDDCDKIGNGHDDLEKESYTFKLVSSCDVFAFSSAALKYVDVQNFEDFVDFVNRQNVRENYLFHIKSPEKVFIPVYAEQKTLGHFFLYIFHLNKEVVEIWDSAPKVLAVTDRDETTKKLLIAMGILFEKVTFTEFHLKMADDILLQPNGFDCGVFVINYMQQSDNYVKRDSSFQFDSKKERGDLALKVLNSDLNKEKQNLYDKARRHYAQVEKQDGNKRLQVDPSKEHFEDVGSEMEAEYDDSDEGYDFDNEYDDEDDYGLENDLIGREFHRYTAQIREWIEDDKVSAIGVWGMGGSGKTALASHIYDKLLEEDNRIKLILTTRIREVCQGMGCDQKNKIEVQSLHKRESLALFKKTMGSYEGLSLKVKRIARKVAYECWGLPFAIVRIATSMKGKKQVGEWSHMLECLKNLGHGQYEMDKWVFPVLRSSYDFLSKKLQRFFLYYALSTKGYLDENADHLIRRFVYESIDETKKLRVQYDEGYNMLHRLNNHSMLKMYCEPQMEGYDVQGYDVQWEMDKFLRALAIDIAKDTGKIIANACKNLTKIPSDDQWKYDLQKAFLTGNYINTIPNGTCLQCSQLSTLLLNGNANLNYISDDFFNNMPALKTLDLSETSIKCLPESVSSLKCLNALLLSGCKDLSYIPPLRNLKLLISLDLSNTAITEAPEGLESLVNLRCLRLYRTYMLMSASLIFKLINLEHLLGLKVTEACVQGLCNLDVIEACFQDISVFNTFVSFLDLDSYESSTPRRHQGVGYKRLPASRDSCCPFCSSSQLVGRLCLSDLEDLKDIVSPDALLSLHQLSLFSYLTHLQIVNCDSMETLMTPKLLALLQNLRTIDVNYCEKMKEIVGEDDLSKMEHGGSADLSHPTPITLPRLTSLELHGLPQLINFVYRGVMLCPSLQTFSAFECEKLNRPRIEISNGCELPMEKTSTGYSWAIKTD